MNLFLNETEQPIIARKEYGIAEGFLQYSGHNEISNFPQPQEEILNTIREVLAPFEVHGICVFGSYPQGKGTIYSDYDFTILCEKLPQDIYERERFSPLIKDVLKTKGITEVCAFNLYNISELEAAHKKNSWLIATMKKGYWILQDDNTILQNIFNDTHSERVGDFMWKGIGGEDPSRLNQLADRYTRISQFLGDHIEWQTHYQYEAEKVRMIIQLYVDKGIFPTRTQLSDLPIDLTDEQQSLQDQNKANQERMLLPETHDEHIRIAKSLLQNKQSQEALLHAYLGVRGLMRSMLWKNRIYAIDGEITQIFLRDMQDICDQRILMGIREYCYQTEQILGRCGYISFDLSENGSGLFVGPKDIPTLTRLFQYMLTLHQDLLSLEDGRFTFEKGILIPNKNMQILSEGQEINASIIGKTASMVLRLISPEEYQNHQKPLVGVRIAQQLGIHRDSMQTPRTTDFTSLFS